MDIFEKLNTNLGPLGKHSEISRKVILCFPSSEGEIAPRMKFMGKEVLTWSLNNLPGTAETTLKSEKQMRKPPENWGAALSDGSKNDVWRIQIFMKNWRNEAWRQFCREGKGLFA